MDSLKSYDTREEVQVDITLILTYVIGPKGGVNRKGMHTLARAKFGCFNYIAEMLLPIERYRDFKFEWDSLSLSSGNATTQARYIARADTLAKHLDAHIKGTAPCTSSPSPSSLRSQH